MYGNLNSISRNYHDFVMTTFDAFRLVLLAQRLIEQAQIY